MNRSYRAVRVSIITLLLLVMSSIVALTLGPAGITVRQTFAILMAGPGNSISSLFSESQYFIVWNLRLPRILTAVVAGMTLAVAGSVFQSVFRNPMADPYVLGISSGAAFGVSFAAFLGLLSGSTVGWSVSVAAGIGAVSAALLVFSLSGGLRKSVTTLLLTGVALNFLLSAAMTLFMYLHRSQLQSIIQWSLGSFSTASWNKLAMMAGIALPSSAFMFFFIRDLDVLLLDEGSARSVGVPLQAIRIVLLASSSIATAAIVSFCGIIGFVGLMVPHIMRLIVGPNHRNLLPCSLLGGALMTVLSDTLARMVVGASELPVGVVTSLCGAPLFIVMLMNQRKLLGGRA